MAATTEEEPSPEEDAEAVVDERGPLCEQCGGSTRGNYVNCVKCGRLLCDRCDVRGSNEEPECNAHGP